MESESLAEGQFGEFDEEDGVVFLKDEIIVGELFEVSALQIEWDEPWWLYRLAIQNLCHQFECLDILVFEKELYDSLDNE